MDRLLRGARTTPARVEGTARWYARLRRGRPGRGAAARRRRARCCDDPAEIAVLFDKRLCHARAAAAGVPVPASPFRRAAPTVRGWDDVRAHARTPGWRRVFVKPAPRLLGVGRARRGDGRRRPDQGDHLRRAGADGPALQLPAGAPLPRRAEIAAIVDALAPDGLHVERWLPKAAQRRQGRRPAGRGRRRPRHPRGRPHQPLPHDQPPPGRRTGRPGGGAARPPRQRAAVGAGMLDAVRAGRGLIPRQPCAWRRSAAGHRLAPLRRRRGQRLRRPAARPHRPAGQRRRGPRHLRGQIAAARMHRTDGTPPPPADPAGPASTTHAEPGRSPPRRTAADMNEVVGPTICCSSPSTPCATTSPPSSRRRPHPESGPASARRRWERRHAPGQLHLRRPPGVLRRLPAHPGHPRPAPAAVRRPLRRAARPPPSGTCVFDAPDLVTGLARGRATTRSASAASGFFNKQVPLGSRPARAVRGEPLGAGVRRHRRPPPSRPRSTAPSSVVAALPRDQRLFLFVNVSALHQPNGTICPAPPASGHAARPRRRPGVRRPAHRPALPPPPRAAGRCFAIVCSDHGTAYGEDGYTGHRLGHEVVWTVPYAQFFLAHPGEW